VPPSVVVDNILTWLMGPKTGLTIVRIVPADGKKREIPDGVQLSFGPGKRVGLARTSHTSSGKVRRPSGFRK